MPNTPLPETLACGMASRLSNRAVCKPDRGLVEEEHDYFKTTYIVGISANISQSTLRSMRICAHSEEGSFLGFAVDTVLDEKMRPCAAPCSSRVSFLNRGNHARVLDAKTEFCDSGTAVAEYTLPDIVVEGYSYSAIEPARAIPAPTKVVLSDATWAALVSVPAADQGKFGAYLETVNGGRRDGFGIVNHESLRHTELGPSIDLHDKASPENRTWTTFLVPDAAVKPKSYLTVEVSFYFYSKPAKPVVLDIDIAADPTSFSATQTLEATDRRQRVIARLESGHQHPAFAPRSGEVRVPKFTHIGDIAVGAYQNRDLILYGSAIAKAAEATDVKIGAASSKERLALYAAVDPDGVMPTGADNVEGNQFTCLIGGGSPREILAKFNKALDAAIWFKTVPVSEFSSLPQEFWQRLARETKEVETTVLQYKAITRT